MTTTIDINIGHRNYKLVVEEGQEHRLQKVAETFNNRIESLRSQSSDIDRDRLLVLAAMMLADDLLSLQIEKKQQDSSIAAFNDTLAQRLESLCRSQ